MPPSASNLFAGIPVGERDEAAGFYERLFGRPPDLIPKEREAAWRLSGDGWIVLIAKPGSAGCANHTLLIAGLEELLDGLRERGVACGPVEDVSDGIRAVSVRDPYGNTLKFAEVAETS